MIVLQRIQKSDFRDLNGSGWEQRHPIRHQHWGVCLVLLVFRHLGVLDVILAFQQRELFLFSRERMRGLMGKEEGMDWVVAYPADHAEEVGDKHWGDDREVGKAVQAGVGGDEDAPPEDDLPKVVRVPAVGPEARLDEFLSVVVREPEVELVIVSHGLDEEPHHPQEESWE